MSRSTASVLDKWSWQAFRRGHYLQKMKEPNVLIITHSQHSLAFFAEDNTSNFSSGSRPNSFSLQTDCPKRRSSRLPRGYQRLAPCDQLLSPWRWPNARRNLRNGWGPIWKWKKRLGENWTPARGSIGSSFSAASKPILTIYWGLITQHFSRSTISCLYHSRFCNCFSKNSYQF